MQPSSSPLVNANWGSDVPLLSVMKYQTRLTKQSSLILVAIAVYGAQPWSKNSSQWTQQDVQRVLGDSPWAQPAAASFASSETEEPPPPGPLPGAAEAGMAGARGVTDGRWDGGVGKLPSRTVPSLPVTVRWDSALPIRQALLRLPASGEQSAGSYTSAQAQKDYIITVIGLVPAGRYKTAGQLPTQSRSDQSGDSAVDPQDPEQMLEGLMVQSRLMPRNEKPIAPEDVKLDAASGAVHLFFPRNELIDPKDKEVTFVTRFGSMTIQKQFRLKDMIYQGKLEL